MTEYRLFEPDLTGPPIPSQKKKHADHGSNSNQRTVGTQSLYRENEAQTEPYSPDYVIPEGTNPEILTLAKLGLNFGQGKFLIFCYASSKFWCLPPLQDYQRVWKKLS